MSSGKCWQRFEPLAPTDLDAAIAAFQARNGTDWSVSRLIGVDPFSGYVTHVSRSRRKGEVGPPASLTHLSLLQRVRAFVRHNADLFGLRASDFDALSWKIGGDGSNTRTLIGWSGSAVGQVGADQQFQSLSRRLNISFDFHHDGELVSVQSRLSPAVALCTEPRLSADAIRKVPGLVGEELGGSSFSGRPFSAGTVRPEDIQKVELTVDEHRLRELLEYRLVYRVKVVRNLAWAFFIDAITGKVLRIEPLFST